MYSCNNECAVLQSMVHIPTAVALYGIQHFHNSLKKGNEERKLKQQFHAQIAEQLQQIVGQTSANCFHLGEQ